MLITGATGFLGRHLVMASEANEWELFAPPRSMIDVRQRARVIDEIRTWNPTAIVHLATRRGDQQTMVEGSRNIAQAAAACGAHLVYVSSDAVFPGRPQPYGERDIPFPITDHGLMKLEAERAVAAACENVIMVRTSLLYGTTRPAPIQTDVERAILGRSTMTFFTDEFRCPAHAADVAAALSALAAEADIRGVLNVAGPDAVSRAEMAAAFARWMGLDPLALNTGTSAVSGMIRPGMVVLDCTLAEKYGLRCRSLAEALPHTVSR